MDSTGHRGNAERLSCRCRECGGDFDAFPELTADSVTCPHCNAVTGIHSPTPPKIVEWGSYGCARCGVLLESPESLAGKPDRCPLCGQQNIVPPQKPARKTVTFFWTRQTLAAETAENEEAQPSGFGGWLIIPAIALILTPISFIFRSCLELVFRWPMGIPPSLLANMDIESARRLVSEVRTAWFINYGMVIAFLVIAFLFFSYRRIAVWAIIGFLLAGVVASPVMAYISASMWAGGHWYALPTIHVCLQAGIWIPYFLLSRRVKNTFTE